MVVPNKLTSKCVTNVNILLCGWASKVSPEAGLEHIAFIPTATLILSGTHVQQHQETAYAMKR